MRRFPVIAIFATFLLPGLALAQSAPPPAGAPPPYAQPPAAPWGPGGPDPHWRHGPGAGMARLRAIFAAANTTHDGHLTFPQAQASRMKVIVDHFAEIDTKNRGYITLNDIQAWRLDRMAQRLEKRAAQLRAGD